MNSWSKLLQWWPYALVVGTQVALAYTPLFGVVLHVVTLPVLVYVCMHWSKWRRLAAYLTPLPLLTSVNLTLAHVDYTARLWLSVGVICVLMVAFYTDTMRPAKLPHASLQVRAMLQTLGIVALGAWIGSVLIGGSLGFDDRFVIRGILPTLILAGMAEVLVRRLLLTELMQHTKPLVAVVLVAAMMASVFVSAGLGLAGVVFVVQGLISLAYLLYPRLWHTVALSSVFHLVCFGGFMLGLV